MEMKSKPIFQTNMWYPAVHSVLGNLFLWGIGLLTHDWQKAMHGFLESSFHALTSQGHAPNSWGNHQHHMVMKMKMIPTSKCIVVLVYTHPNTLWLIHTLFLPLYPMASLRYNRPILHCHCYSYICTCTYTVPQPKIPANHHHCFQTNCQSFPPCSSLLLWDKLYRQYLLLWNQLLVSQATYTCTS